MKADSWITGLWKHETMLIPVGFIYIHAMMLYVNQSVMCEQVTAWREIQNEWVGAASSGGRAASEPDKSESSIFCSSVSIFRMIILIYLHIVHLLFCPSGCQESMWGFNPDTGKCHWMSKAVRHIAIINLDLDFHRHDHWKYKPRSPLPCMSVNKSPTGLVLCFMHYFITIIYTVN